MSMQGRGRFAAAWAAGAIAGLGLAGCSGSDDAAPAFPAGATFHYTNVAYALLGEVVARHRGGTWWEQTQTRILEPLGMTRTTLMPQAPHALGWAVHPWADVLLPEPAHDAALSPPVR